MLGDAAHGARQLRRFRHLGTRTVPASGREGSPLRLGDR